ncbi:ABATE domain-containing protein [Streptomyces anulatus]|uniref:CGNR zinc finger domain-containing protein n=1 Tax=Streptomyces anulatus TaxID=1892 RepID=UPI002E3773CA|nr:ABATE domain-containing protein [Streptomyces anulatus]
MAEGVAEDREEREERGRPVAVPLTGEPLPLELVNTTYIKGGVRGRQRDALAAGPEALDSWLAAERHRFAPGVADALAAAQYQEFLVLRRALRALAGARTSGEGPDPEALAVVNAYARTAADWRELAPGPEFRAVVRRAVEDPLRLALGAISAAAVELFGGEGAERLRACPAPGCILYFVRTHARREWCTVGCGNRVRVARHSKRAREGDGAV